MRASLLYAKNIFRAIRQIIGMFSVSRIVAEVPIGYEYRSMAEIGRADCKKRRILCLMHYTKRLLFIQFHVYSSRWSRATEIHASSTRHRARRGPLLATRIRAGHARGVTRAGRASSHTNLICALMLQSTTLCRTSQR